MAVLTCANGHQNPEDQQFCGQCGARLGISSDVGVDAGNDGRDEPVRPAEVNFLVLTDGLFALLVLIGMLLLVGFILAMLGAGEANVRDKTNTFMYIAGLGALPWGIASLIAFGLAGMRAKAIRDEF